MSENAEKLDPQRPPVPPACDRTTRELLAHVIDGERWPTPDGRAWLDAHLASCAACRQEAALLQGTDALLARAPASPLAPGFEARLKARIAREGRAREDARPLARPFWHWAAGFAVAASMLIASVVVVLRLLREDTGSPRDSANPVVVIQTPGQDPESPPERPAFALNGPRPAGAVDSRTEEEIIAKLDVLENLDVAENMDLIENLEGPEDPTSGLEEEGHG